MIHNKLKTIDLDKIQPKGYFKDLLELQLKGITLDLDEYWPYVGNNSDWLGGSFITWERPPYWLDGLIPLSYLLKNEKGILKIEKWINHILNSQRENGDFGATYKTSDFDESLFWPKYVILKALISYYECTNNSNVLSFMKKYFYFCIDNYNSYKMKEWARARGGDFAYCIYWLYDKFEDEKLLRLIGVVNEQTHNWSDYFTNFPFTRPTKYYYDWDIIWKNSTRQVVYDIMQFHATHVVNVAMGIKQPIMEYKYSGDIKYLNSISNAIENLKKYHGQVTGMFSGDEHLAGINPTQGTELCAVVEMMFSLQVLFEATGNNEYIDLLERITYNALPGTILEDFKGHQYVQQVNQVMCNVANREWYNLKDDSNIYGYEPNFGCCLANLHQGFPKFTKSAILQRGDEVYVGAYMPISVMLNINNIAVKLEEETTYPFNNVVNFKFFCDKEVKFPFNIRIPNWCDKFKILVNNTEIQPIPVGSNVIVNREFRNLDEIKIIFDMGVKIEQWDYNEGISVVRGPIVYALNILEERIKRDDGLKEFPNIEIYPKSKWNYALDKKAKFEVIEKDLPDLVFDKNNPPVVIKTVGRDVMDWVMDKNVAGDLPISPVKENLGEKVDVELIPYGCSKLRIALFPWSDINE
ncbi:MAG: beta-L-arabinofuranosidase domain-containing protein [Lachnospirales bacterium]